jgi:hypothetical protein
MFGDFHDDHAAAVSLCREQRAAVPVPAPKTAI